MSAVITIIAELAPLTSAAKEASDDLSAKHPTVLIEKLVDNIQKKLGLTKLARKGSDKGNKLIFDSVLTKLTQLSVQGVSNMCV